MLRENKRAQFEAKRDLAKLKTESRALDTAKKGSIQGQLGHPLKQFNEVAGNLSKLRQHFD